METRDYAFDIWKLQYPNMDKSNFKTFNQFYEEIKPKKVEIDIRTEDEIMHEILEIEKSFKKGGE